MNIEMHIESVFNGRDSNVLISSVRSTRRRGETFISNRSRVVFLAITVSFENEKTVSANETAGGNINVYHSSKA